MKDSYYFSHDSNALTDPKILSMRCDYGMEGYGVFWAVIEMLRVQDEYRLELNKLNFNALKMLCMTQIDIEEFVNKCINEYKLFETDGKCFWSESLRGRMEKKDTVSQKRKGAASKRWEKKEADINANEKQSDINEKQTQSEANEKQTQSEANTKQTQSEENANAMQTQCKENANAKQTQCKENANAMQNDTKKRKEKESKEKENKEKDFINTFCAEPKVSVPKEEIIIELALNDKSQYPVYKADIDRWGELYPAVDIIQELRKMAGWIEANPQKRKTRTGIKKFINAWLSKAQDKGGNLAGMPRSTTLSDVPGQFKTAKEKSYEAMMRFAGGGSFG